MAVTSGAGASVRTIAPGPLLIPAGGRGPTVHPEAFVAPGSILVGDVVLEPGANVWFGVVLRADLGRIVVRTGSNVQDGTIAHADQEGLTIGADVTVGHRSLLHGRSVGDGTLIGMGAILLGRSVVGSDCIVGGGSVITEGTAIPDGSKAWGVPACIQEHVSDEERAWLKYMASACREEVAAFRTILSP